MSEPRLVLATRNPGKLRELREILRDAVPGLAVDAEVVDAGSLGVPDVPETGTTFAENSLLKARAVHEATGLPAIADDSGLSVDVLHGAPGIFSARWSGRHGDDAANLRLLLAQLADIPDPHRGAAFVCAASLVGPDTEVVQTGRLPGRLLTEPRGQHGFGYDPILVPEELPAAWEGASCAEIPPELKNAISHRARAFTALTPHIAALLDGADGGKV